MVFVLDFNLDTQQEVKDFTFFWPMLADTLYLEGLPTDFNQTHELRGTANKTDWFYRMKTPADS